MFNPSRTIVAEGSAVPFDQFMEWALYHPETGYYIQPPKSIIGKEGDFFTAAQLQPTFGQLIDSLLPAGPVLELGPGRGEMREAFAHRGYRSVGPRDDLPESWSGTIFANEFFDALPVKAGIRAGSELRELNVRRLASTYGWEVGGVLTSEQCSYVHRYYPQLPDQGKFEIAERAVDVVRRIGKCLVEGTLVIVDYGWTANEYLRFPEGTLMSYRNHTATCDVLANPGRQDITAHLPFGALMDTAAECGFQLLRFETLAKTLAKALEQGARLPPGLLAQSQLKTLLFGMGESFRTLWLQKSAAK